MIATQKVGRQPMIRVTRLNGTEIYVNAELIRLVERTPDTVISLTTGDRVVVSETPEEVVAAVVAYRSAVCSRSLCTECGASGSPDGYDDTHPAPDGCSAGPEASEDSPPSHAHRTGEE